MIPCKLLHVLAGHEPNKFRNVILFCEDGKEFIQFEPDDSTEIENVPEKREYWINVYRDKAGKAVPGQCVFFTEHEAKEGVLMSKIPRCLATIKIWEEEI